MSAEVTSSGGSVVALGNICVFTSGLKGVVAVVEGSVVGSGKVMAMSGGQVGLLPKKVTSARCTQSEPGVRKNLRVSTGMVVLECKHILTSE